MLKKIFKIAEKIILSILIIYGYNIVAEPLNVLLPINFVTVILFSLLGVPSMLCLILFYIIFF